MGRASAVGRASDVAVEWEGLVLTWHGKGEWEGRVGRASAVGRASNMAVE